MAPLRKSGTIVIAFCASKGGAGKTTACSSLSAMAAEGGRVAMLDLDPQKTLHRWWELRGQPDNPKLVEGRGALAATVARLRSDGYDFVLIDTPPANMGIAMAAVTAADLVLVPVQPSAFDLEAIAPVVDMCREAGRAFAFVVNRTDSAKKLTTDAVKYLKVDGQVLATHLSNRPSYRSAPADGKTAAEVNDKVAREEIDALWRSVKKLVASARVKA
jgi:chromosome partitioning protein